jgi:DNA polymerase-3 subunit alpha
MTLQEWLLENKIQHEFIGRDICRIPNFGDCFIQDIYEDNMALFKVTADGEVRFNCADSTKGLIGDGVRYVIVPFGDNWYYVDLEKDFKLEILKYVGTPEPNESDIEVCNLACHDAYELLNGSFLPKDWVRKAKWLGHRYLGIANKNTMASLYNFQKECDAAGIKPVFGYSFTCRVNTDTAFDGKVFVQTQEGLQHLLRIQKAIMVDNVESGEIPYEELERLGKGLVLILGKLAPSQLDMSSAWVHDMKKHFDSVFYQVDLTEYKAPRIDDAVISAFQDYWSLRTCDMCGIPPVIMNDCYYLDKSDAKNKIILNKIACGAAHEQSDQQFFRNVDEQICVMKDFFESEEEFIYFFKCASERAIRIAEGASARFENTRNFMPKYDMLPEEKAKYGTTHNMFNQLLQEGLDRLAPKDRYEKYKQRMLLEKYIIESTDNIDYLLVQWDSTNWCRRNGIYVGCGRGSAAGSLLLYLLGITLVDPLKYSLLFERFLLPERAGLYLAKTTKIQQPISSSYYINVSLENGRTIKFDRDAKFLVNREGSEAPIEVYADELKPGDDIILDNKDRLFTINEI